MQKVLHYLASSNVGNLAVQQPFSKEIEIFGTLPSGKVNNALGIGLLLWTEFQKLFPPHLSTL